MCFNGKFTIRYCVIAHIYDAGEWGRGQTADEGSTTQVRKIDCQK